MSTTLKNLNLNKIPNIQHFIFGLQEQNEPFMFAYYLSVYSASKVNNPDKIYFYYHWEPYGEWWNKLKEIPNIELVKVDLPTHIGEHKLYKTAHRADQLRMEVLWEKGGVYMDIDTISVKPYHYLLENDVVLGKEMDPHRPIQNGICNAVMFSKPNSLFFKTWRELYPKTFNPNGWREASIVLPEQIAKQLPMLLKLVEADYFFLPNYTEVNKIFSIEYDIPENLTILHYWETFSIPYLRNIKGWDWAKNNSHTLFGKIMNKIK